MSYATYSAATGLPPISPNQTVTFNVHQNRDVVRDNKTVVRKARIATTKSIRANQMYATVDVDGGGDITSGPVNMPFNGYMTITIAGNPYAFDTGSLTIVNPYVQASTPVIISDVGTGGATREVLQAAVAKTPGQITITTGDPSQTLVAGQSFSISVGRRNDVRQ